jgi:hypothetical protein
MVPVAHISDNLLSLGKFNIPYTVPEVCAHELYIDITFLLATVRYMRFIVSSLFHVA